MNPELMRRYTQPVPVSAATALHYRQYRNSSSVASSLGSIPDPHELLNIKADLEALLPLSEKRARNLQIDLIHLKKNVKFREQKVEEPRKVGKTTNPAIMEKMQIKQESTDESCDVLHSTSLNKNQMERQLALEALRRKRRREEDIPSKNAGSNHHLVKLKRLDNISPTAQPTSSKSHSKSGQGSHTKKKKSIEAPIRHSNKQSQNIKNRSNNNNNNLSHEVDFIRVKAKDQVPVVTFWTAVEPYFKVLAEEDREFLIEKHHDEKPYIIPPLGRHYTDVWSEDELPAMSRSHSPATSSSSHDNLRYVDQITDDHLFKDDITCGNLTERLLSSLVPDDNITIVEDEDDVYNYDPVGKPYHDIAQFEERLKSELRYAGLFGEDDMDWNTREDDEICAELRLASRELKEQYTTNEYRKKKLLNVVDNQLQYEQYRHVLDNLDVQVEQCYLKRFRTQKSKKRKTPAAQKSALSEHAVHAMGKRKAWVDALEGIFKDKNLVMPSRSIYNEDS
ncbi:histone acetyltransferases subunit 3-domain-containing protein [Thamnidium elegans]|nr:histone acetyltransferases subunit 3-domain-containing protein [Thamnidium elegans]